MNTSPFNLAVDIGNSSIKIGRFQDSKLQEDFVFDHEAKAIQYINALKSCRIILSSVKNDVSAFSGKLKHSGVVIFSAETPIPFINHYDTKDTLGLDRLAAMAGAQSIRNFSNLLVVDIGTCITYDFMDHNNIYQGGSISPGIELRFKAMNSYTSKLPLIRHFEESVLIGKSTKDALISGVLNGITVEIDGIIAEYKELFPDLQVFVCGGGINCFESKLKAHIFAAPKLVLIGLNRILEYNEES